MQQSFTQQFRSDYPYLNPLIEIVIGGRNLGSLVSRLNVVSDLREKADTCVVMVSDVKGDLESEIPRGRPLSISWGYAGQELTEIFRGVVREVGSNGQLIIRGIDWNVLLNSGRVNTTFEDETIAGIIKAALAATNLKLEIEECDITPDRFPGFGRTIRDCVDELNQLAKRETGNEYLDHIRSGTFYWGRKHHNERAVRSFRTGVDIIRTEPSSHGIEMLETMVCAVQHRQVIDVDGERRFILRCEYNWDAGGRTRVWSERC